MAIIPDSRLVDWTYAGIPGGIPTLSNIVPLTGVFTDGTDQSAAINAAIVASSAGDVLLLPTGTILVSGRINGNRDNRVLRGQLDATGGWATTFDFRAGDVLVRGNETFAGFHNASGTVRGSTFIPVFSGSIFATGMAVGQIARIWQQNNSGIPITNVSNINYLQSQFSLITGRNTSGIFISPPLTFDLSGNLSPQVSRSLGIRSGFGLENIRFDCTNRIATGPVVQYWAAYQSWMKNCWIYRFGGYHAYILNSVRCDFDHNRLEINVDPGPNRAGFKIDSCSSLKIVDNILLDLYPAIEINGFPGAGGTCGNVIAYNFAYGAPTADAQLVGYSFDSNHGPHTQYELYEGNMGEKFINDGYYGSSSDVTVFRNWLYGVDPDPARDRDVQCVSLERFTRNYSIVGNVLGKTGYSWTLDAGPTPSILSGSYTTRYIYKIGYPNPSNFGYNGFVAPSTGLYWADWGTNVGPNGFQEIDMDVRNTTILSGNFNMATTGVPASEAIGEALPNSYYLTSKPSWFGGLTWPPFSPSSPNMNTGAIPAGWRYIYNNENYLGSGSAVYRRLARYPKFKGPS